MFVCLTKGGNRRTRWTALNKWKRGERGGEVRCLYLPSCYLHRRLSDVLKAAGCWFQSNTVYLEIANMSLINTRAVTSLVSRRKYIRERIDESHPHSAIRISCCPREAAGEMWMNISVGKTGSQNRFETYDSANKHTEVNTHDVKHTFKFISRLDSHTFLLSDLTFSSNPTLCW